MTRILIAVVLLGILTPIPAWANANVTMQPSGTGSPWTMTLPSSAGTGGGLLQTDGTGVTSWSSSPLPFSFTNNYSAGSYTTVTSNAITLQGGTGPFTATCGTGCTGISINGAGYVAGPVSGVYPGDTIAIEQTSGGLSSTTSASVTVGNTVSTPWNVTATTYGNSQTFTSSGTWTNPGATSIVAVVVGGGGGGGYNGSNGAGGGGGGGVSVEALTITTSNITVTVGSGGTGDGCGGCGSSGGQSSIVQGASTLLSANGGTVGAGANGTGAAGGTGTDSLGSHTGGAAGSAGTSPTAGGSPTASTASFTFGATTYKATGGGGGGGGSTGGVGNGAAGGTTYYASGGAGGTKVGVNAGGGGGASIGAGGAGGDEGPLCHAAAANTGGGGGADTSGYSGCNGGSGKVIIFY